MEEMRNVDISLVTIESFRSSVIEVLKTQPLILFIYILIKGP